jgi:hypothetical protein
VFIPKLKESVCVLVKDDLLWLFTFVKTQRRTSALSVTPKKVEVISMIENEEGKLGTDTSAYSPSSESIESAQEGEGDPPNPVNSMMHASTAPAPPPPPAEGNSNEGVWREAPEEEDPPIDPKRIVLPIHGKHKSYFHPTSNAVSPFESSVDTEDLG